MKIAATTNTAILAGAWSGIGLSLLETATRNHPLSAVMDRLAHVAGVLVFFVAPVPIFVFGVDDGRWQLGNVLTREYWREYPQLCLRVISWFLAGAASVIVYSWLVNGRWPS